MSDAVVITDAHRRAADLRARALAEVAPGDVAYCYPIIRYGRVIFMTNKAVPGVVKTRAGLLAVMAMRGPEASVTCPVHSRQDRPDLWDACHKVSVTSALLGRPCGAP